MSDASPNAIADFKLEHANGILNLPATAATESPSGVSISKLLAETGYVTLDPGFMNTASCTSAITAVCCSASTAPKT